MNKNIILAEVDEFCYMPMYNFYPEILDKEIIIAKGYSSLYPFFNKKIEVDLGPSLFHYSFEQRHHIFKAAAADKDIIFGIDIINKYHPKIHIYKYLFSNYTKWWLEEKKPLFFADQIKKNEIWNSIKDKVQNRPIIAFNGRNLPKHQNRNNLLLEQIKQALNEGFFVVNLTINPPCLDLGPNYLEPEGMGYFDVAICYLELAQKVVSVGDSGGITTLFMCDCNVEIVGGGGWVDNPEFGYEGDSIVSARTKSGYLH